MEKVYLIGHRGASGNAPENTLASFDLALENGVDAIELDIHQSKDGEIVAIHDDSVDRTTNGKGLVSSLTCDELKKLDAGSWFDKKYSEESVPLLDEIFSRYKKSLDFILDIKLGSEAYPGIEKKICSLIESHNVTDKIVISSTKITILNKFKNINCNLKLGKIIKTNEFWRTLFDPSSFIIKNGLLPQMKCITPHWTVVNPNLISVAHEHNLDVYPWTVDKERLIRTMIFRGVDGIITNFPEIAKKIRDQD